MQRVAIVGAGLIGRSWANVFARAGWKVRVWDPRRRNARRRAALIAPLAARPRRRTGWSRTRPRRRRACGVADTLEDAVGGADYVQESGPEVLEVKRATFAPSTRSRPRTACSPRRHRPSSPRTSPRHLAGRARCLVAHPVNPPHLVPVVELCGAPWTSAATRRARARSCSASARCRSTCKREIDGFVLNRLQAALLTEAFRLVQDGYVSPAGPRPHHRRRARPALGLHGPVRDDRAQRPGGHRRLLPALRPGFRRYVADLPDGEVWDDAQLARAAAACGAGPDRREHRAKERVARRAARRAGRAQARAEAVPRIPDEGDSQWSTPLPSAAR